MAVGDTLALFDAMAARSPSSGYPQIDSRNGHYVLDFDDSVVETTIFQGAYPQQYAGGNLEVVLTWAASSAVSDETVWQAALERQAVGGLDLDADAFGAAYSAAGTANATSGRLTQTSIIVAAADAGSPAAGEGFRLQISRDADAVDDTMTGDAELLFVELREAF